MYSMVRAPRDRIVTEEPSCKGTRVWSCAFLVLERWEECNQLQELFLFLRHLEHPSSGKLELVFPQGGRWDSGRRANVFIPFEFRKKGKYTI